MEQRALVLLVAGVLGVGLFVGGLALGSFAREQLASIDACRAQDYCNPTAGGLSIEEQAKRAESMLTAAPYMMWTGAVMFGCAVVIWASAVAFGRASPFVAGSRGGGDAALVELRMRYARGEISHEEFERRSRALEGGSTTSR